MFLKILLWLFVLKFVNSLKLFGYGFSWGGFESLALYQTNQALGKRQFTHINKDEHIIRMHIGLEDPKDIINDIKQALKFIKWVQKVLLLAKKH